MGRSSGADCESGPARQFLDHPLRPRRRRSTFRGLAGFGAFRSGCPDGAAGLLSVAVTVRSVIRSSLPLVAGGRG